MRSCNVRIKHVAARYVIFDLFGYHVWTSDFVLKELFDIALSKKLSAVIGAENIIVNLRHVGVIERLSNY